MEDICISHICIFSYFLNYFLVNCPRQNRNSHFRLLMFFFLNYRTIGLQDCNRSNKRGGYV